MNFINRNCTFSFNEIEKLSFNKIFNATRHYRKRVKKNIEEMRGGDRVTSQNQEEQYKALENTVLT